MAHDNAGSIVQDWTSVNDTVIVHSTEIDTSGDYETDLQIQAGLGSLSDPHTGTRFIVQISSLASGDEDWAEHSSFVDLIGTSADITLTTAALAAATNIIDTDNNVPSTGSWMLILDGDTNDDNEMVFVTKINVGSFDILDGLTNGHEIDDEVSSIAFSRNIKIRGTNILRARLVVDNNYDTGGAQIQFKLAKTITTSL